MTKMTKPKTPIKAPQFVIPGWAKIPLFVIAVEGGIALFIYILVLVAR